MQTEQMRDQRIYGLLPYEVKERLERYLARTGRKQGIVVGEAVLEYLERHDV